MGNSFGITPSLDKQYMNGVVRTKVDDCQVRCVHLAHISKHPIRDSRLLSS